MHNIPYHANYYDIESLMKPYIEIKELILFLDRFNRFKGSAKIILRKEEEYEKILNYSGKLSIFNRLIFLNKFRIKKNNTSQKKINNYENFKRNQLESSNQHEEKNIKDIKNKEWFEKNFLNKNNDKNNNNKNTEKKQNREFSTNQIVIFNLPNNILKETLLKSFKNYNPDKIIILNNKKNNLKYSFITFPNQKMRDGALSFNGVRINKKKIIIKKAFLKKNIKEINNILEKNNIFEKNKISPNSIDFLEKRIINLENEIDKLKLIIKDNNTQLFNKPSENKNDNIFNQKTPNILTKLNNDNKLKNNNKKNKLSEIEIQKEEDNNNNKSNCEIIFNQKINKPSLEDFYISIGQTVTKQKPILRSFSFTNNNLKMLTNWNLPKMNFFETNSNNIFKLSIETEREIFDFLKNFERKRINKNRYQKNNDIFFNQLIEHKNNIINQNLDINNNCKDLILINENNENNLIQKNIDYFFSQKKSINEVNILNENNNSKKTRRNIDLIRKKRKLFYVKQFPKKLIKGVKKEQQI
ncbi:ras gtpase-activating protein-binding protein [Anaeramoeba flamelloides]|uniref:Ras gtpase-activating protein-binding protein n=1 Tax=Anaeramoeba flamelloides TaxID=1746091 RepID=A0ABQ8YKM5_9EUKA|nr:ras gtpase-activating protein-binding protein [Anaeramoeba flamelloides]